MTAKPTVWHLTDNGLRTLCGHASPNRIHRHYANRELDEGTWCALCRRNSRTLATAIRLMVGPR